MRRREGRRLGDERGTATDGVPTPGSHPGNNR